MSDDKQPTFKVGQVVRVTALDGQVFEKVKDYDEERDLYVTESGHFCDAELAHLTRREYNG